GRGELLARKGADGVEVASVYDAARERTRGMGAKFAELQGRDELQVSVVTSHGALVKPYGRSFPGTAPRRERTRDASASDRNARRPGCMPRHSSRRRGPAR